MSIEHARAYVGLFDPFRLRIARGYAGLRKTELARVVHKTPAAITQYESGAKIPSAATLASLSLALGFPVEFFARDGRRVNNLDLGKAFFRGLRSTRQIHRDQAEAQAFLVSELAEAMQRHVRMPTPNIPDRFHVNEDASRETIEDRAQQLRAYWEVPEGPIANMVRLLEANGILVTRCRVDCNEVSAFSRWFRKGPIIIIEADQEHMDRIRFNAAHELGHLLLHAEVEPANRILEQQADRFASSFLMPRHLILNHLPRRLNWSTFGVLKQTWGVSIAALLYRSRELGCLSEATYRRAVMTMNARGQRKNESDFPLPGIEDTTLLPRAMEIIKHKGYSLHSLAKEVRLPISFVEQVISGCEDQRPVLSMTANEPPRPF